MKKLLSGFISLCLYWVTVFLNVQAQVITSAPNLVPKILQANLVAEWRFSEGWNQRAFNYVNYPDGIHPLATNLLGQPEQYFNNVAGIWAGSGSVTDYFVANPIDANQTAARWVDSTGSDGFVRQTSSWPAGSYTASMYVKSNNGSTQHIRLSYHTASGDGFSPDIAVTTSWTQVSWQYTSAATMTQVYFPRKYSSNSNVDILIYGPQLVAGTVTPSAYVPANYDLTLGGTGSVDSNDPAWSREGVNTSGGKALLAAISTPVTLTSTTVYAVVKWSGGVIGGQAYYTPLNEQFNSQNFDLSAQQNNNPPAFAFAGQSATSQGGNLNDNRWHILVGSYDGTTLKVFVDNIELGSTAANSLSVTLKQIIVGNTPDLANSWPGSIGGIAIYNVAHTTNQVYQNEGLIQGIMAMRGVCINDALNTIMYVAEGDSITDFQNLLYQSYFFLTVKGVALTIQGRDFALSGSKITGTTSSLLTRAASVDVQYNANRRSNVLTVLIGANDLDGILTPAGFVVNLKSYCLARKAVGWKVVVGMIPPQKNPGSANPNFIADRNAANTLILADPSFYDAVARLDTDPDIGCDTCGNNTTYYPDGVHPSAAGAPKFVPYFITAVQSVY